MTTYFHRRARTSTSTCTYIGKYKYLHIGTCTYIGKYKYIFSSTSTNTCTPIRVLVLLGRETRAGFRVRSQVHVLERMYLYLYLYFAMSKYKIQPRADKVMTARAETLLDSCYFLLTYDDLDKKKLVITCCLLLRI